MNLIETCAKCHQFTLVFIPGEIRMDHDSAYSIVSVAIDLPICITPVVQIMYFSLIGKGPYIAHGAL